MNNRTDPSGSCLACCSRIAPGFHGSELLRLLLAAACLTLIGCHSPKQPASANFASVRIQGHTADQIRGATVVVFQQDGYTLAEAQRSDMVFEREAGRWDQIAYGNWVNEAPVWIRVRVSMVPLSPDGFRLQCQAYKVRNKGDPLGEQQVRISSAHSKTYLALLEKVRAQMNR
jgi:hypothetical protein